jgi:hypothetical protein
LPSFRHVIEAAYLRILGRAADPGGLAHWDAQMNAGLSEAGMREALIRSEEYRLGNPGAGVEQPPPTPGPEPTFPIRAAFYYPWFPEAWDQGGTVPFTHFTPARLYDSGDADVIRRHLACLEHGRFAAGILSWWGQGHPTDGRVSTILGVTQASGSPLRWGFYHERESTGTPSVEDLRSDLQYLAQSYGAHPAALRIGGRLVVFVFADAGDGCGMATRWKQAAAGLPVYVVLKVVPGYTNCPDQPDGWHEYGPAVPAIRHPGHSYTISPGFHLASEPQPRLVRDLDRWKQNIRDMVASREPWQLVTSFNEWGEGTPVEPAAEWPSESGFGAYLDALHSNGGA